MSTYEELMFDAAFDLAVEHIDIDARDHAHTGDSCVFCATRDGEDAKTAGTAAVTRDLYWWKEAEAWLKGKHTGARFTADDLVAAIGKPWGSSNQIGARLRSWAMSGLIDPVDITSAGRAQSHGRLLRVWAVAA